MNLSPDFFAPLQTRQVLPQEEAVEGSSYWRESFRRLRANRLALLGIALLFVLSLFAIFGPLISPYEHYEMHLPMKNSPPSAQFIFGTDELGRDMFTRTCCGARISLFVGITAALLDLVIGIAVGSLAGCIGGKFDEIVMRCVDILYSIPHLLVVIMLMVVMGPGIFTIIIALTFTGWIGMARIVRGQILQLKQLDFVRAAEALGASRLRILLRHLIPNAMGPILATMTLTIPTAIFAEAFLSFLGLGVQAPAASWGSMASTGVYAMRFYPWRLFVPASFISLTMLCFNLVGDGIRDAFDPRLRT
jgi:oligopeptide transport system permease protein